MSRTLFTRSCYFSLILLMLSACSSLQKAENINADNDTSLGQSFSARQQQLTTLTQWQITGKIAFLQGKKRQSANLNWRFNGDNNTQRLALNTFLGINVFRLESKQNLHLIEVDGKKYQGENLEHLIYSLTGLIFPTDALPFWLKAMPFRPSDKFILNEQNQLPVSVTSDGYNTVYANNAVQILDNNGQWQISYSQYKVVKGYHLPFSLTLKKNNLMIKIAIRKWLI